jgi:two-component system NarL family response regulator
MRVLLVDDHLLLLEGLTNLLSSHGIAVLGEAHDGREAVQMARDLRPDVILMDLQMPEVNGLEATRLIKAELPEVQIVILTSSTDDRDLFEAIKSGACGYLLKSMRGDGFVEALKGLEDGFPPFSSGLAAKIMAEFTRLAADDTIRKPDQADEHLNDEKVTGLTARQKEVLLLLAEGLSYKEAGVRLALSPNTVKYHLNEIIKHLHLENRAQAFAYAARLKPAKT